MTGIEELGTLVGQTGEPHVAWDAVNTPMIRHWCDAMQDDLPAYTDPAAAAASPHGQIVAPPSMLMAWTMPGLRPPPTTGSRPAGLAYDALDAAGFTSVVATDTEHEYLRYLRVGDLLSSTETVEEISAEKQTALGLGHFVTTLVRYSTESGEEVGRMRFRILKFKPGTGRVSPAGSGASKPEPPAAVARPQRNTETQKTSQRSLGEDLPPCSIEITPTLIVAGAIASRDYQDVHHDRDLAIKRGSPDIFMNILTTSGLFARYVTDWAGPEVVMRNLKLRLGAPNYPGDRMVFRGQMTEVEGQLVTIQVEGHNSLGAHVTGQTQIELR